MEYLSKKCNDLQHLQTHKQPSKQDSKADTSFESTLSTSIDDEAKLNDFNNYVSDINQIFNKVNELLSFSETSNDDQHERIRVSIWH
jgi:hypothetical protein